MPIIVSNEADVIALNQFLVEDDLVLKLYSNDLTPTKTDTAASFTEVAGGGYADIQLPMGGWIITAGTPNQGVQAQKTFSFTGATNAPGTIYGYYVVDSDGVLRWSERFADTVLPFTPIAGSTVKITPKFAAN